MKKTLIALTLASMPVAASADVVLYGMIKGGVEVNRNFTKETNQDGSKVKQGTSTKIVDYGSRIGFKGHEDLSSNLRAIWQVEQNVSIGGTEKGFANRDSFIGLAGGFGEVKAGYLSTPTKEVNARLDQWEYSDNAAGLGIYTRTNEATKRAGAISYETPSFGGFKAKAYVSPSDNNNGNSISFDSNNKDAERATYGAKLGYENAGFFAETAGTYVKNTARNLESGKGHDGYQAAANVGYDNGNWLAGVGYQQSRYVDTLSALTGETLDGRENGDNGAYTVTTSAVKRAQEVVASAAVNVNDSLRLKGSAAYGFGIKGAQQVTSFDANDQATGIEASTFDKLKYTQGIVGADYNLSKRTALNGQVGYLQWKMGDAKLKKGTVGVGMSHKF